MLLLLALLPFGSRYIFNFEELRQAEFFKENLSISVFIFDAVFLMLLWQWLADISEKKHFPAPLKILAAFKKNLKNIAFGGLIISLILICLLNAPENSFTFYNTFRLLQGIFLFLIVGKLFSKNFRFFLQASYVIFLSGVLQALIGILQFIKQKSVGLKILGESLISPDILGVAKIEIAGEKIIRAYGTFPHPNLFAAFLFFSLICGLGFFFFHSKEIPFKNRLGILPIKTNKNKLLNIHYLSGLLLIFLGILVSYSRSVWLISLIAISIIIWKYLPRSKINYLKECLQISLYKKALAILFSLGLLLAISWLVIPRLCLENCPQDKSFLLRQKYNEIAAEKIKSSPFFGTGIGGFVLDTKKQNDTGLQEWELQPVHNLYLMIMAEIGVAGFAILITLVFYRLKNLKPLKAKWNKTAVFVISGFLLLGFIDHYFWTLPQGIIIFWLALAFLSAYGYNEKESK